MKTYEPEIVSHVKVCGNEHTYCAHPLMAGEIFNFGNGEIAFTHCHTEGVDYKTNNINHGQNGIHSTMKRMITRSYDGGLTWHEKDKSVFFDSSLPLEEQQKILSNDMTLDNYAPVTDDTIFNWGFSYCGKLLSNEVSRELVPFCFRSEDKGHTWNPGVIKPVNVGFTVLEPGAGSVRQEKRMFKPFIVSTTPNADETTQFSNCRVVLYTSEDDGLTWEYIGDVAADKTDEICYSYANIHDLGNGHLFVSMGAWRMGYCQTRWISCCHSYDNGLNWTEPKKVRALGISPYSLLLRDGRIIIIYAKRYPYHMLGIYGIISEDNGETWSEEFIIRKGDVSGGDIGYPVATEIEDGKIFTGYYYMSNNNPDGKDARYIAGTIFKI